MRARPGLSRRALKRAPSALSRISPRPCPIEVGENTSVASPQAIADALLAASEEMERPVGGPAASRTQTFNEGGSGPGFFAAKSWRSRIGKTLNACARQRTNDGLRWSRRRAARRLNQKAP